MTDQISQLPIHHNTWVSSQPTCKHQTRMFAKIFVSQTHHLIVIRSKKKFYDIFPWDIPGDGNVEKISAVAFSPKTVRDCPANDVRASD